MTGPNSYIICAYDFDGKGRGNPVTETDILKHFEDQNLFWLHMDVHASETEQWLKKHAAFLDHITLDALLAEETRPRLVEHQDGALIILRGVNLQEGAEPEDMISIRLWIDARHILSTRIRKLKAVTDIREKLEQGNGPANAGDFLTLLISRLTQRMEPTIMELDEDMDDVEAHLLDNPDTALRHKIIDIRKRAIALRRYIAPQKDVLSMLRNSEFTWLDTHHKRLLQENYDRLARYVEELDAIRERAQIVKDELASALADRMNKNMYLLSLIAALFLPLGFLTGLLGINVGGMPGADSDIAFWIVCILCGGFIAVVLALFRLMKWI